MSRTLIINRLWSIMDAAESRYGPIASSHEAMGVALEEWDEFRAAVHANDLQAARAEALDLAAVMLRFAEAVDLPAFRARSGAA